MQTPWVTKFVLVALVGGMWFVNYGLGGTLATAVSPVTEDPPAGVTQNREKNLPNTSRFTVLTDFGGAAVRDNNTGLVWEQAPDTVARHWLDFDARMYCVNKNVGGRVGWRLPSEVELTSLKDRTLPAPFVPSSVFTGVQPTVYWSASGSVIPFNKGLVIRGYESLSVNVWCVRGGMNADAY